MLKVGQCESCEGWFLARELLRARVERPATGWLSRRSEDDAAEGRFEPVPPVIYLCRDCTGALWTTTSADGEESPERSSAARSAGAVEP